MKLVPLTIPPTMSYTLRSGENVSFHPWTQRARSYVARAVQGKADPQDVAQELAVIASERGFLTIDASALPVRPSKIADPEGFSAWRKLARYAPNRVAWRVLKLAIRRACHAARSAEDISARIADELAESRALSAIRAEQTSPDGSGGANEETADRANVKLRERIASLSNGMRKLLSAHLASVARKALAQGNVRPLRDVRRAADRFLSQHGA